MVFKTLNLALTFYAGQAIPFPPGDKSSKGFEPYVKVELHVDATEGQGSGHITSDGYAGPATVRTTPRSARPSPPDGARVLCLGLGAPVGGVEYTPPTGHTANGASAVSWRRARVSPEWRALIGIPPVQSSI